MQNIKGVVHNEGCMMEQTVKQQICFYKNSLLLFVCNGKDCQLFYNGLSFCEEKVIF